MKQKFKVGQKLTAKTTLKDVGGEYLTKGKKYPIVQVMDYGVVILDNEKDNPRNTFGWDAIKEYFENPNKTLTIKKLTRTRAGKKYFTTQFSVKGKIVGHQHNSKQGRDKSLNNFIKYIQNGDFKIVNK